MKLDGYLLISHSTIVFYLGSMFSCHRHSGEGDAAGASRCRYNLIYNGLRFVWQRQVLNSLAVAKQSCSSTTFLPHSNFEKQHIKPQVFITQKQLYANGFSFKWPIKREYKSCVHFMISLTRNKSVPVSRVARGGANRAHREGGAPRAAAARRWRELSAPRPRVGLKTPMTMGSNGAGLGASYPYREWFWSISLESLIYVR